MRFRSEPFVIGGGASNPVTRRAPPQGERRAAVFRRAGQLGRLVREPLDAASVLVTVFPSLRAGLATSGPRAAPKHVGYYLSADLTPAPSAGSSCNTTVCCDGA